MEEKLILDAFCPLKDSLLIVVFINNTDNVMAGYRIHKVILDLVMNLKGNKEEENWSCVYTTGMVLPSRKRPCQTYSPGLLSSYVEGFPSPDLAAFATALSLSSASSCSTTADICLFLRSAWPEILPACMLALLNTRWIFFSTLRGIPRFWTGEFSATIMLESVCS